MTTAHPLGENARRHAMTAIQGLLADNGHLAELSDAMGTLATELHAEAAPGSPIMLAAAAIERAGVYLTEVRSQITMALAEVGPPADLPAVSSRPLLGPGLKQGW